MNAIATFLVVVLATSLQAGVTIHYEGHASSTNSVEQILAAATSFAKKHGWKIEDASAPKGALQRVIDEKNADYEGRITGITIRPGERCEPLHLQFGDDLFMQDFVKTQFAGADTHIAIIELLAALKPHFRSLRIDDEAEYWQTRDRAVLEKHFAAVNKMMEDLKKQKPKIKGPVIMPSGRIIDVVE